MAEVTICLGAPSPPLTITNNEYELPLFSFVFINAGACFFGGGKDNVRVFI